MRSKLVKSAKMPLKSGKMLLNLGFDGVNERVFNAALDEGHEEVDQGGEPLFNGPIEGLDEDQEGVLIHAYYWRPVDHCHIKDDVDADEIRGDRAFGVRAVVSNDSVVGFSCDIGVEVCELKVGLDATQVGRKVTSSMSSWTSLTLTS